LILLDTHVLVWFLQGDLQLGSKSREQIEAALQNEGIGVSAISFWEIAMLVGKKRIRLGRSTVEWVRRALALDGVELLPLEPPIAITAGELPGLQGDLADRILIATARIRRFPLMTSDRQILAYAKAGRIRAIDASH
jgi:PIN domain nuclease of toxin-antitoxin system